MTVQISQRGNLEAARSLLRAAQTMIDRAIAPMTGGRDAIRSRNESPMFIGAMRCVLSQRWAC